MVLLPRMNGLNNMPQASIIMVCGMRRSGSTLTQVLLSSDTRAHPPQPESQVLTRIVEAYAWSAQNFDIFGRPYFTERSALRNVFAATCRTFISDARRALSADGVLVLKHPALFKVLAEFQELVPEARVVVTVRDPRDQIASELEVARRAHGADAGNVKTYALALQSWFGANPDLKNVVVIRYEDLVGDFSTVKKRLESELDLELNFDPTAPWPALHDLEPMRAFPAWGPKYGGPVDASSVSRFRAELTPQKIAEIEATCRPIMEQFGYHSDGSH